MAKALDLEEQEQLDQIKHFWRTWGNLISWVLIAVLGSYAAWNGYQYWQRTQATRRLRCMTRWSALWLQRTSAGSSAAWRT
jgi:predicted negative regulator of RcsB-dependent stress response